MAGVSQTNSSNTAAADGVSTVFNFTFFAYSIDTIKVYSVLNDVLTPITTGITKVLNPNFIGGTVTFAVAPAIAVGDILIRREVPYTQGTELADLTRLKETAIEAALNTIVLQVQQLQENDSRSLKYTEAAGITDSTIEEPIDGAALAYDGTTGRVHGVAFSDLSEAIDVVLTGLAAGDFLKYNGTAWINRTSAEVKSDIGAAASGANTDITSLAGTATNDSAAAGKIGEYQESVVPGGGAVAITSDVSRNITSLSLTAGDWEIIGIARFSGGATTTVNYLYSSLSTVTAALDDNSTVAAATGGDDLFAGGAIVSLTTARRLSIASTTTIFLTTQSSFATSTMAGYGIIMARRVR